MKKNFATMPDLNRVSGAAPAAPAATAPAAKDADAFINGGMDGKKTRAKAGRKTPISLTIEPHILEQLDEVAKQHGISRASAFSMAVSRFIDAERRKQG